MAVVASLPWLYAGSTCRYSGFLGTDLCTVLDVEHMLYRGFGAYILLDGGEERVVHYDCLSPLISLTEE